MQVQGMNFKVLSFYFVRAGTKQALGCATRALGRAASLIRADSGTGLQSFVIKGVNLDRLIGLFCTERADWRIAFYLPLVKSYMATMQHCWQAVRSILCTRTASVLWRRRSAAAADRARQLEAHPTAA